MSASAGHIILIGRFPPPTDGQAQATLRLKAQLSTRWVVHHVNTMIPAEASAVAKMRHYHRIGCEVQQVLDAYPSAPVIWSSISPEAAGHWRDRLAIFPRLEGRNVIAVVHWGKFAQVFTHPLTRRSARRRIPALTKTVFTADVLSDACAPWIPERRRAVIPNTLDAAMIPERARPSRRADKRPRILFVANMLPQKGWPEVLKAAALLQTDGFEAEWVFAGAWPDEATRHAFQRQVEGASLSGCVSHHGAITDRAQLAAEYEAADLFVLPSWLREAQPLTILEAMAAGVPCVVADDGGMPDLVGTDAGRVIPARNAAALAHAIRELLEPTKWAAASIAARKRFEVRFAPESIAAQWERLLEEVI